MITENDSNKLAEAGHSAGFLVRDLRALVSADEELLGDMAIEILQHAVQIEQRLNRIASITKAAL